MTADVATPMRIIGRSGAAFSPCRRYRYLLWRIWDPTEPLIGFGMLNPSWAGAR